MKPRRRWDRCELGPAAFTRGHVRHCQDCGRCRPATTIYFAVTGMAYRVCGECIRAYRAVILAPCSPACIHNARRTA